MELKKIKDSIKALRLIQNFLMFFVFVMGVVIYGFNYDKPIFPSSPGLEVMMILPALILIGALFFSPYYMKKSLNYLNNPDTLLKEKITTYTVAHLIRVSLFEAAGLAGAAISFVTESKINLVTIVIVLFILYTLRPTTFRISNELNLSLKEREQLNLIDQED